MVASFIATGMTLVGTGCSPAFVRENEQVGHDYLTRYPERSHVVQVKDPQSSQLHPFHYVTGGTPGKPKVIFVHGSPGSWDGYAKYFSDPKLSTSAYLVSVDRAGYGGSEKGVPEPSLLNQMRRIQPLLDLDDPTQPVILVGHSFGGPVVVRLAMEADSRVRSMVILAGSVDPSLEQKKWFQYPADWFFIRWLLPSALDVCNQEIEPLKGELEKIIPLWPKIRAHVTVIQGLEDDLVPPGNADFVEARIDPKRLQVMRLPGVNHFVPWLKYDLVTSTILDRVDAATKPESSASQSKPDLQR